MQDWAKTATRRFTAPANGCVGNVTLTADRRSLFATTAAGLARFDTHRGELAEFVPDIVGCRDSLLASPSGLLWYALSPIGLIGQPTRLRVIDAVSRQVVSETLDTTLRALAFGPGSRYELHQLSQAPAQDQYELRRADDVVGATPTWHAAIDAGRSATQIAFAESGVFALVVAPDGTGSVVRFNPLTGGETGRVRPLEAFGSDMTITSIALTDTRLYVAGFHIDVAIGATPIVGSVDAVTLASPVVSTRPTGLVGGSLTTAPGAPVAYLMRPSCLIQPHMVPLCSARIGTIDLATLGEVGSWSSVVPVGATPYVFPGQIVAPGTPKVRGVSTAGGRVEIVWEPDASGAQPRQFVVRGGVRGQPAMTRLAMVDGSARTWRSEVVPPGEYALELVAVNPAGESVAARADIGIDTTGPVQPPTALSVLTAGRSVATLRWDPPATGPLPSGYVVEAAPQGGPFAPVLRTILPELTVSGIPAGTWQARVRAVTASGVGLPSEPVAIASAPCVFTDDGPRGLAALTDGTRVTLQWASPLSGPAVSYRIDVASDAAFSHPLTSLLVDGASTSLEVTPPPGVYAVRVTAMSACSVAAISNAVVVRVP